MGGQCVQALFPGLQIIAAISDWTVENVAPQRSEDFFPGRASALPVVESAGHRAPLVRAAAAPSLQLADVANINHRDAFAPTACRNATIEQSIFLPHCRSDE